MASQDHPQTEPSSHQIHQCHLQALQVKWASFDFVSVVPFFTLLVMTPPAPFRCKIKMNLSFWHYLQLVYFQRGKQRLTSVPFQFQ